MFKRTLVLLAASATAIAAAPAYAVTYTTSTEVYDALGDELGSDFDIVSLTGVTGDLTGFGTYLLNTVSFEVGVNSNTARTVTGSLANNTATIGSFTLPYSVAYALQIGSSDTITLGGNSYRFGNVGITINPLTLSAGIGQVATGQLTATIAAVPEPATWAMMIGGIGFAGGALRNRRQIVMRLA